MTLEQVKMLRDSYNKEATKPNGKKSTLGEYIKLSLDGGIDLVTSKDLVIFDDNNLMVHAICINENMDSQCDFPVKVISCEYSYIQQIESILSQKNFEDFIDNGPLSSLINTDKKEFIIKWTRNITNQAQQPLDAYYYNSNPSIMPMHASSIEKEKFFIPDCFIGSGNNKTNYKTISEAFSEAKNGDTIKICSNAFIDDADTVVLNDNKELILDLNQKTITAFKVAFIINSGKLTVKNGKVISGTTSFRVDGKKGGNPSLILEKDVSAESLNQCCIIAVGNAEVTSSAKLKSYGTYATIQGNGNKDSEGTIINIIEGSISSNDIAIYHPQNGNLNISGGTISGTSGIYVKSGNVEITGGTIVGDGSREKYDPINNGANSTGDAIIADMCGYPGGDPKIDISGNPIIISINGMPIAGYKAGIEEVNPEPVHSIISISGGSFNKYVESPFLDSDCKVNFNTITKKFNVIKE